MKNFLILLALFVSFTSSAQTAVSIDTKLDLDFCLIELYNDSSELVPLNDLVVESGSIVTLFLSENTKYTMVVDKKYTITIYPFTGSEPTLEATVVYDQNRMGHLILGEENVFMASKAKPLNKRKRKRSERRK